MNIIQIIPTLGPGGAEKFVVDLSNSLAGKNKVTLITLYSLKKKHDNFFLNHVSKKVNLIHLNKKKGFDLLIIVKLFFILCRLKPMIINTHLNCLIYVFVSSLLLNMKIVHTFHNIAKKEQEISLLRKIYKIILKFYKITPVAISKTIKKTIKDEYFLTKIPIVENGVYLEKGLENLNRNAFFLKEIKFIPKSKIFLAVGRLSEQKNFELLISAFNKVSEKFPKIVLIIIGDGQNKEKAKLYEIAGSNIIFTGLKKNVRSYINHCDVFCLSSKWEGQPISILEAMSHDKIVCATPVGGIPDIIKNNVTGFLSEGLDIPSFTNTLESYMNASDKNINIISKNVKKLFNNRFNFRITSSNYLNLYRNISSK